MSDSKTSVWQRDTARRLAEALVVIDDPRTMRNFLRDVMTETEIIEISSRLEAARLLQAGRTYTEIAAKTQLSSRTIARISEWLQNGCDGYSAAIATLNPHHGHLSPARAA